MVKNIVSLIIGIFASFSSIPFYKEIVVFIISLMPILELRGGLIAAALLDLNPVSAYIISIIGNVLPVPFILWFINSLLKAFRNSNFKFINKTANWLDEKVEKHKGQIEKFGFWGLVFFVGIPLPGTGAWTGCLIAAVLEMDRKKSFIAAMIGILMASIIMMILSFGLLKTIVG